MDGLSSVAVISAHGGHRFRPPPKSGHFQTETGGFFAPNWVATLDRNEWPLCSEIRNYSAGGEIGVKMTSAIGNLAGHPFKLVRLFKSTDYVYE